MSLVLLFFLIIVGFAILIKGADWLVDGAVGLAHHFRIPNLIIGLTIVAFGTSFPELVVNIFAAWEKNSDFVLGNIIGSNIANITLIIGLGAIFSCLTVKSRIVSREIPFMILSAFALLFLLSDKFFDGYGVNILTRSDGVILLLFFIIFIYYLILLLHGSRAEEEFREYKPRNLVKFSKIILLIIAGLFLICLGGKIIINQAVKMVDLLQISSAWVGLVILALGTSLPELAASLVALKKKEVDVAVGNLVGSNIFNTFFILGVSSLITNVFLADYLFFDLIFMVVVSCAVLIFSFDRKIKTHEGVILFCCYLFYLIYISLRG